MPTDRPIVLNAFTMNTVAHLSPGLWRHPRDEARRYLDLEYWTTLARTLERGLIDAVFVADVLGVYDVYAGSRDAAVRGALQLPVNDPLQLVPAMAAVTEHLGFGITASVSFEHPYPFARRMSTLDHLTRGRAGWNVVTSYLNSGALNMGLSSQMAHDRRYDIAEEYLEVCYKLWERSWQDDAVVLDADAGIYADPARVHDIAHEGEFFTVPGIHLSEPSPQRTPVIYQAGASPRGIRFAARHAENIFVASPTTAVLGPQVPRLRAAIEEAGRDPSSVAILNQHTVVVAETDAEAHRLYDEYQRYAQTEGALALMSGWMGIDLAAIDADAPLDEQPSEAIQSTVKAFSSANPGRRWTIQELGQFARIGGDGPVSVGSPQTVADELEGWIDETGLDGFNLAAAAVPETFERVVDLLVPELQRRGRYKRAYRSGTLREKLTGNGPRVPAAHPAARVTIPSADVAPRADRRSVGVL